MKKNYWKHTDSSPFPLSTHNLKLAIIDSSDAWYAQPKQIYDEIIKMGFECLWAPKREDRSSVPEGYITICIANNLGPIDFNTRKPLQMDHPPLKRAYTSDADFLFAGDKTTFLRFFKNRSNAFYMPYAVNSEIYKPLKRIDEIYDVGFVGYIKLEERKRRIDLIKQNFRSFFGTKIFMEEANEAMNKCKIIFNTSDHREINMRVFEALATGKLLVTDKVAYLDELFEDGVHLVTYSSEDELFEKINYYLKNETKRKEIAARGLECVTNYHTYKHRAEFIIEKIITAKGESLFSNNHVIRSENGHSTDVKQLSANKIPRENDKKHEVKTFSIKNRHRDEENSFMKLSVSYNFFNGEELLYYAVKQMRSMADHISIVYQEISNTGNKITRNAIDILNKIKKENLVDDIILYNPDFSITPYQNEHNKRKLGYECAKANNATHFLCSDADEFYKFDEFQNAKEYIINHDIKYSACHSYFYIKQPFYRSREIDGTNVCFICAIDDNTIFTLDEPAPFPDIDRTRSIINKIDRKVFFKEDQITMHHMNFVRKDFSSKFNNTSSRKNPQLQPFLNQLEQAIVSWNFGQPFYFPNKGSYEIIKTDNHFNIPVIEQDSASISNPTSKDKREDNQNNKDKPNATKVESRLKNSRERKLNILLATNHLFEYAGSEITIFTIAKKIREKGHTVFVYAKYTDNKFINIFHDIATVSDSIEDLSQHQFDAAYIQHHSIALEVRNKFPTLPLFLASLGVVPFLEQPPFIDLGIHKYLAISEEVKNNLMNKGIKSSSIEIFRNIVDTNMFKSTRIINPSPLNAIVYSYKIAPENLNIVQKACESLNIRCRHIGEKPGAIDQKNLADELNRADIVFTLGRGVIETMMCGKIPIVYDYQGGDGIVTPENIHELMSHNFSGRRFGKQYQISEMADEIKKYNPENAAKLRELAIDLFDADKGVDKLISWLKKATITPIIHPTSEKKEKIRFIVDLINITKEYTEVIYNKQISADSNKRAALKVPEYAPIICPEHFQLNKDLTHRASDAFNAGHVDEAEQLLTEALSYNPDSPQTLYQYGILKHQQGKTRQAVPLLEKAIGLNPADSELANDLGALYYQLGEEAKATGLFHKAIELDNNQIDARKNLADLHAAAGRITEAEALYNEILTQYPDDSEATAALERLANKNTSHADQKYCPVCGSTAHFSIIKFDHPYYTCSNCTAVFTPSIDPKVIVTNNNGSNARHEPEIDNTRLSRLTHNAPIKIKKVLDFGCGNGEYGRFLESNGIQYLGIDQDTELHIKDIQDESIDGINIVEVIEHLYDPITYFKEFYRVLRPGGRIYMESTFFRNQYLATWDYLNPAIGHCLVHSERSLDLLSKQFNFLLEKFNDNCFLFTKPLGAQRAVGGPIADLHNHDKHIGATPLSKKQDEPGKLPLYNDIVGSVSIIIPAFNQVEYTSQCLEALYKNSPIDRIHEVIIVDNASGDGTREFLERAKNQYPKLKVLTNKENLLFARACNQGGNMAEGDCLVFLNNDTEPLPCWLERAINRFEEDDSIGIVGIKLLYPDMTVQHCGIRFYRDVNQTYNVWPLHRYINVSANDPRVNEPKDMPAVTGACLFIRRDLFRRIGGFEERYGMYFEDTDLCFKARRAGKRVFYEPTSVVIHHEGKSSPNREIIDELNAKSARLFFQLWKHDLYKYELDTFIENEDGRYVYLSDDIWTDTTPEKIARIHNLMMSFPPCYVHFGGSGDALLLLSTFYDRDPEQIVVSISNSTGMMRSFFDAFPRLKKIYFIPFPENYIWHFITRRFFKSYDTCLGMGATPTSREDYEEWKADLDIFDTYGIRKRPSWAVNFDKARLESMQVSIQPRGSLKGMIGSKRNAINPKNWHHLLSYLEKKGIKPIIIGTPDEAAEYPCLGTAIDKRSYSFTEQMQLIAASNCFIGADSWGKTFSALAGIPTFVFHAMRGDDLKDWKDASDHVFLDPWEEITVVKDFKAFKKLFDAAWHDRFPYDNNIKPGQKHKPPKNKDRLSTITAPVANRHPASFRLIRNEGMGDVLMALPAARALKQNYPASKITFITDKRYVDLVSANPYIDDVIIAASTSTLSSEKDLKKPEEEKSFDLNPARFGIGERHQIDAFLDETGMRIPDKDKEIVLQIPDSSVDRVNSLLEEIINSFPSAQGRERPKTVLLHAAKNDPNRTWPERHWNRLAQIILEQGHLVIATGSKSSDPKRGVIDISLPGIINLVDQLSPLEFVALCRESDLLITTDSGVVQLAGASNIAIAGIYTVIPGRCRLPYRHGKPMWNSVSIEPECRYAGCYIWMKDEKYFNQLNEQLKSGKIAPHQLFSEWCLMEDKYICLRDQITPEIVWQKGKALLLHEHSVQEETGEAKGAIEELLHRGEECFEHGDLKAAVETFRSVLRLDPQNSEALNNLGVIQWQLGSPVSAIKTFQAALKLNPGDSNALGNLAEAAWETSRFDLINPALMDTLKKAQPANPDLMRLLITQQDSARAL